MNKFLAYKLFITSLLSSISIIQIFSQPSSVRTRKLTDLDTALPLDTTSELRYAAFGTSRTWGAQLQNRKEEAFPWLLSTSVSNYAIRGSDARYPSLCMQSIISDSIYDVIIVEYDRYGKNLYSCISDTLRRLRQRFPDSTIILTNLWLMWDFDMVQNGGRFRFPAWLRANDIRTNSNTPDILAHADRLNATIEFSSHTHLSFSLSSQLARRYNLQLYSWYSNSTAREAFTKYAPYFSDFLHWNGEGHLLIAYDIRTIVQKSQAKRSNVVSEWVENDQCSLWLESGIVENNFKLPPEVVMNNYDVPKGKFALEFPPHRTTVQILNVFQKPQKLFLTFLATYPNRLYPKMTIVTSSASSPDGNHTFQIDPYENHGYPAHFPILQEVGVVYPGVSSVTFIPLQTTEAPFRLLGFSISEVSLEDHNSNTTYSWFF